MVIKYTISRFVCMRARRYSPPVPLSSQRRGCDQAAGRLVAIHKVAGPAQGAISVRSAVHLHIPLLLVPLVLPAIHHLRQGRVAPSGKGEPQQE